MAIKKTDRAQFMLRLDRDLLDRIDARVTTNDLSRNETIVRMIRHALDCKR